MLFWSHTCGIHRILLVFWGFEWSFTNQRQYSMVNIADGNQVFRIILLSYKYINQLEEKIYCGNCYKKLLSNQTTTQKKNVFYLVRLDDKDMVFLGEDNYCSLSGFWNWIHPTKLNEQRERQIKTTTKFVRKVRDLRLYLYLVCL